MNPNDIVLLGLKKSVTAFHRSTGQLLWKTELDGVSGGAFITLISDERHVFACGHGLLSCLNLQSGTVIWSNPLKGYGYGIAGLCLPDAPAALQAAAAAQIAAEAAQRSASSTHAAT